MIGPLGKREEPKPLPKGSLRRCGTVDADEWANKLTCFVNITFRVRLVRSWIYRILMLHNTHDLGIDNHIIACEARVLIRAQINTAMLVELIEHEDRFFCPPEGDLGFEAVDASGFLQGIRVHAVLGT